MRIGASERYRLVWRALSYGRPFTLRKLTWDGRDSPYRLALEELKVDPEHCLFVAGSAYDLVGTAKVGLPTYWHDRIGMKAPEGVPAPLVHESSLKPLLHLVLNLRHFSA